MSARKTKAASVAAVPAKGKSASADANSTKSRSAEDKTKAKVKAKDTTKAKSAGVPAGGENNPRLAKSAFEFILKDIGGAGVAWDESNTADLSKVFTVRLRLDIMDRIKLGVLASRCGLTPEEYLSGILRENYIKAAEELVKDKAAKDFCEAVYFHSIASLVNVDGFMRLAFVPAIIA